MNGSTDFLYARPSFLEGWARAIDLGGTLNQYNDSPTSEQADWIALAADWEAVGNDIEQAAIAVGVALLGPSPDNVNAKQQADRPSERLPRRRSR